MKKLLEIKGCRKAVVIEGCSDCPMCHIDCENLDFCRHPERECELATYCKCPLPDATEPADVWPDDENHRLGPNGERLIAVDHVSCKVCFLCGQPSYSQNAV